MNFSFEVVFPTIRNLVWAYDDRLSESTALVLHPHLFFSFAVKLPMEISKSLYQIRVTDVCSNRKLTILECMFLNEDSSKLQALWFPRLHWRYICDEFRFFLKYNKLFLDGIDLRVKLVLGWKESTEFDQFCFMRNCTSLAGTEYLPVCRRRHTRLPVWNISWGPRDIRPFIRSRDLSAALRLMLLHGLFVVENMRRLSVCKHWCPLSIPGINREDCISNAKVRLNVLDRKTHLGVEALNWIR